MTRTRVRAMFDLTRRSRAALSSSLQSLEGSRTTRLPCFCQRGKYIQPCPLNGCEKTAVGRPTSTILVIACSGASRAPAEECKFPKVYSGLAEVIVAPPDQRPAKLKKFVEQWYQRISPIYWHESHQAAEGAYFGYWCFEAALVSMVFDIDDRELLNHPHYPGDLTQHYRAT